MRSIAAPIFSEHIDQLERLLSGPDPIVVIPEADDGWLGALLERLIARESLSTVRSLDAAGQVEVFDRDGIGQPRRRDLGVTVALGDFLNDAWTTHLVRSGSDVNAGTSLVWLRDVNDALREPVGFGRLKAVATRATQKRISFFVLVSGQGAVIPSGVQHLARLEALIRPTRSGPFAGASFQYLRDVLLHAGFLNLRQDTIQRIEECVQGLEASAIRRIILRAAAARMDDALAAVRRERNRTLSHGAIEVREASRESDTALGGLDVLQAHFGDLAALFDELRSGSEGTRERVAKILPKGLLLAGLPGCGKSLAAEVAARTLKLPLLQLHVGRLMDRWLGSSEERLDAALATAQAAAPCVLWIDEIDKAVSGMVGGDTGGTGSRMLGRLLTWMQENRSGVYVIATANHLDEIPPELLRRGRFDDHFKLGRPKAWERRAILLLKAREYGAKLSDGDLAQLVEKTDKFSGADLDALVREATKRARLTRHADAPSYPDFEASLSEFRSQVEDFGKKLETLEQHLAELGFRDASSADGKKHSIVSKRGDALPPLARQLAVLFDATQQRLVRWPLPVEGSRPLLEFATEGGERRVRYGLGDAAGIPDENVVAFYRVTREGDGLRLFREIGRDETTGAPPQFVLRAHGNGLTLEVGGVSHAAEMSVLRRAAPLPPALWPLLAGETTRMVVPLWLGKANVQAICTASGEAAAREVRFSLETASAAYSVSVEGDLVVLTPTKVFGKGNVSDRLAAHRVTVGAKANGIWTVLSQFEGSVQRSGQIITASISHGIFRMGSPRGDKDAGNDEKPQREVRISRAFWAMTTPVTQQLWREITGNNPSHFKGHARRPVEQVSWCDVIVFANLLSAREGLSPAYTLPPDFVLGMDFDTCNRRHSEVKWNREANGYRLPTEAEWEFMARAGTTTRYWSGDTEADLDRVGWYNGNSGGTTHPVGEKNAPNPWGLHDVHGNVFEWCFDAFGETAYQSKNNVDSLFSIGDNRVLRGGSWSSSPGGARAANRDWFEPGVRNVRVGVRLVRSAAVLQG